MKTYKGKICQLIKVLKKSKKIKDYICFLMGFVKSCGCIRKRKRVEKERLIEELKILPRKEVAKKYGYSLNGFNIRLNKLGIKTLKNFNVKHDYFKTKSSSMYYILGFITADGSIHKKRPYITIELNEKDRYLLEFIKNEICPRQNILEYKRFDKRTNKTYSSIKIAIYSEEIKKDLEKLGIKPNKTSMGLFINVEKIPEKYFYDFIRGLFDGDGCISLKESQSGFYNVCKITCSDFSFLEKIQKRIDLQSSIQKEKTYYNLVFGHNPSLELYKLMYKDCESSYYLERKKEKFIYANNS